MTGRALLLLLSRRRTLHRRPVYSRARKRVHTRCVAGQFSVQRGSDLEERELAE